MRTMTTRPQNDEETMEQHFLIKNEVKNSRRRNENNKPHRTKSIVLISATLLLCGGKTFVEAFPSLPQERHVRYFGTDEETRTLPYGIVRSSLCRSRSEATKNNHQQQQHPTTSTTRRQATKQDTDTWSKPAASGKSSSSAHSSSSRFGVRSRVRSVLEKAKNRTGIRNNSTDDDNDSKSRRSRAVTEQSARGVIAEAASIGGLGAVVVDEETGTVDVALDFKNGKSELDVSAKKLDRNGVSAAPPKKVNGTPGTKKKTTSLASTWSPSKDPKPNPEDDFIAASTSSSSQNSPSSSMEVDALKADVSAAFSMPPSPLPFTLPKLNSNQLSRLHAGERIEFQEDMGRQGSGFVVLDVKATPDVVWDCLLDFNSYPETIPTVRDVMMYTDCNLDKDLRSECPLDYEDGTVATLKHGIPSVTRARFSLSKFRLKIAAIHKYRPHQEGDYMIFTLDPSSTNLVLKSAKGVWHTQPNPDGRGEEYTRVWLLCELRVSSLLPKWIVDYASQRAMPRATTWLRPQVEAAANLWLKKDE